MTAPKNSSSCAPTPNFPWSTARCGSTTRSMPPRRTVEAAMAYHRSVQSVWRHQVLQRRAQEGRAADHRRRHLARARWPPPAMPARHPVAAAGAGPPGLSEPERDPVARVDRQCAARQPGLGEVGVAGGTRRQADRALRRPDGRSRPGAGDGDTRARDVAQRLAALFRAASTSSCSAQPGLWSRGERARDRAPGGEVGLPVVATHPIQFLEPDDFEAHELQVCVAGDAGQRQARAPLQP